MNSDIFALAGRIADAACFFDTVRAALPERDRNEAGQHAEHLHDAAQILAGKRSPELYIPEDAAFVTDIHYHAKIVFYRHAEPVNLSHWREKNGLVNLCVSPFDISLFPTPTECRRLAAALKQLADDAESSAAQGQSEQHPVLKVAA